MAETSYPHRPPPSYILPRFITILVIVSVVVNVVLAIAFGIAVFKFTSSIHQSQQRAITAIHNSQVDSCRTGNRIRKQDVAIWDRLLNVPHPTHAALIEIHQLEHLVSVKDTPVNCAVLYRVP